MPLQVFIFSLSEQKNNSISTFATSLFFFSLTFVKLTVSAITLSCSTTSHYFSLPGKLYDAFGDTTAVFLVAGVSDIIGGVLALISYLFQRRDRPLVHLKKEDEIT